MNHKSILLLSALLFACQSDGPRINPVIEVAAAAPTQVNRLSSFVGWWKSDEICLDLTASGDVELSLLGEIKVIIIGDMVVTSTKEDALELQFSVSRIWESKWVSNCRREVGGAKWLKEKDALGLTMKPNEKVTLTLSKKGGDEAELCGAACVTLKKNSPRLAQHWRHPERLKPRPEQKKFAQDELIGIELRGSMMATIQLADGESATSLYGDAVVTHQSDEQFQVVFTPRKDMLPKKTVKVLGVVVDEDPFTLAVKKTPGHRIEVCRSKTCATLERFFQAD